MKIFFVGIVLTIASFVWLGLSVTWGENPFNYHLENPWYHTGSNLNFWMFHVFSVCSHVVLGAGLALCIIELRLRQRERS